MTKFTYKYTTLKCKPIVINDDKRNIQKVTYEGLCSDFDAKNSPIDLSSLNTLITKANFVVSATIKISLESASYISTTDLVQVANAKGYKILAYSSNGSEYELANDVDWSASDAFIADDGSIITSKNDIINNIAIVKSIDGTAKLLDISTETYLDSALSLTLTALEANSTVSIVKSAAPDGTDDASDNNITTLKYTIDNGATWNDYTVGDIMTLSNINDSIRFKNTSNTFNTSASIIYHFDITGNVKASNNVNSLLNFGDLSDYCFCCLFERCSSLTDVSDLKLPSKLADWCYAGMFTDCTSLTKSPIIYANSLVNNCYLSMFNGCSSLNEITVYTTTWNEDYTSYWVEDVAETGIFYNLGKADIPTGYNGIPTNWVTKQTVGITFTSKGDSTLTLIKEGSPKNIDLQYSVNNSDWKNFEIGKTYTLANNDTLKLKSNTTTFSKDINNYYHFKTKGSDIEITGEIDSLIKYNSLPPYCFYNLFVDCENIIEVPSLPSTNLSEGCYSGMFRNCTSLLNAPKLPATILAAKCYSEMFYGCTSISSKINLPAGELVTACYYNMFSNCEKLNYVEVNALSWNTDYTQNWLNNVAPTGTFAKSPDTEIETGASGIPEGWTVKNSSLFTLKAVGGDIIVSLKASDENVTPISLLYDIDSSNEWKDFEVGVEYTLAKDSSMRFKSTTSTFSTYKEDMGIAYYYFEFTTDPEIESVVEASGDIRSLINYNKLTPGCFAYLFSNCSLLTKAPELPDTDLAVYCYGCMFMGCISLTEAPELPATTLSVGCYYAMFAQCRLTEAPKLPATVLAPECYEYMFWGCTELAEAPTLQSTDLSVGCYYAMFAQCTSLTKAPKLPVTNLSKECYEYMFYECTSLTEAPELPAATLAESCYMYMFTGCTELNYINVGATEWNEDYAYHWVEDVASTGTFVKPSSTSIPEGDSGIPSSWEIQERN